MVMEVKKTEEKVDAVPAPGAVVSVSSPVSDISIEMKATATPAPPAGRKTGPARRSAKGGWTEDEDELLRQAVSKFNGKNWKKIAEFFPNRSDVQCLHRWQKVLDPKLIKGPWTREEDDRIIDLVNKYGTQRWSFIAKSLEGRIGKQCRERWHNQLDPQNKKEAWTPEEEAVLIEAHEIYGNKWAEIAKKLPGRADNAIKNHWNCSVKKRLPTYSSFAASVQQHGAPVINTKFVASQEIIPVRKNHRNSSVKKRLPKYSSSGIPTEQHGAPVVDTKTSVSQEGRPTPYSSIRIPTHQHGAPVADTKFFDRQGICPTPCSSFLIPTQQHGAPVADTKTFACSTTYPMIKRIRSPALPDLELAGDEHLMTSNKDSVYWSEMPGKLNLELQLCTIGDAKCQETNLPTPTVPEFAGDVNRRTSRINLFRQGRPNVDSKLVWPENSKCQETNQPTPTVSVLAGDGCHGTTSSSYLIHQYATKGRLKNVDSQLICPEHSKCQEMNRPTPTVPELAGDGNRRTTSSIDLIRQSATEESLNMDSQLVHSERPKCQEVNNQPSSNCIGGNMKQNLSLESRHCLPIKKRYIGSPSRSGLVRSNLADENKSLNATETALSNLPACDPSHTDKVDDPAPTTPGNSGSQLQLKDKQCSISDKHISRSEAYVSTPSDWGSPSPIAILRTLGKGFETPSIIRKRAYRSSGPVATVSGRDSNADGDSSAYAKRVRNFSESEYAHKNLSSDLTCSLDDDRFFRSSHELNHGTTKSLVRKLADEFGTDWADS